MTDREDVESATSALSDQEKMACFPKVQSIVAGFNTPGKTKIVSSTRATPASSRRHQPNRFTKAIPCMKPASSSSSVNTIGSSNGHGHGQNRILDPVQVYCRVRPNITEDSCIKILDNKSLEISPPETSAWRVGAKAMTYSFEQVFDGETNQQTVFDEIALPLVKDFLQAKNSLLFAYGITGSGKTYTMSGTPNEPGIMPRCLDVIFNSISDVKAIKYQFKPDHLNGFDVQSNAEAMLDRQKEMATVNLPKTPGRALRSGKNNHDPDSVFTSRRAYDTTILPVVNKNYVYSVFITYLEIYNNYVNDLLEESQADSSKGRMRMLREDVNHNVYVNGITEIEVQSADEAFEVFNRGQRQRRMAHTNLNDESSRSHSIFNIRLVQAPLDEEREVVDQKNLISVSQLSLVDLAGSERYGRTGATGERLKEAGNINTSLMTLRKCMDALRENQRTNSSKIIPYRDTKLTHFLKNYFDGEGRVRMVLCVNPRGVDYDENLHVMTFAELTREVQVARPQPVPKEPITPMPKRKAAEIQKPVKRRLVEVNGNEHNIIESISTPFKNDINLGFGVSSTLPIFKMIRSDEEHILINLRAALQTRISERQKLHSLISNKRERFRTRLVALEKSLDSMNAESAGLKYRFATVSDERESIENVLRTVQFEKAELDLKIEDQERQISELKEQLENCQMENRQREVSHMKQQEKLKADLEREKMLEEIRRTRLLHKEEAKLKAEFKDKEKTLAAVRQLVTEGAPSEIARRSRSRRSRRDEVSTSSESDIPSAVEEAHVRARRSRGTSVAKLASLATIESPTKQRKSQSQPQIANPMKYRSRSTDNDKWLEHAVGNGANQETVFQPLMRNKKSVNHLTKPEDITVDTTKYCLRTQQIGANGDVETVLVKGDVLPTAGGGAQVVFTDAETMRQLSPQKALSPSKKHHQETLETAASSQSRTRVAEHGDGWNKVSANISPSKKSRLG